MANKNECMNFKDYIDNPAAESIPQSILQHQESCAECKQYLQMKISIRENFTGVKNERVNLWGEFRTRLAARDLQDNRTHSRLFQWKFAGAVGVLMALVAIFSFMLVKAPVNKAQYSSLKASNYTQVSDSDTDNHSEMNDLEYYYEISSEI